MPKPPKLNKFHRYGGGGGAWRTFLHLRRNELIGKPVDCFDMKRLAQEYKDIGIEEKLRLKILAYSK